VSGARLDVSVAVLAEKIVIGRLLLSLAGRPLVIGVCCFRSRVGRS
jgi:hypothetical protein